MTATTYTNVHPAWVGLTLYEWGTRGLKNHGNRRLPVHGGRPRTTFNINWLIEPRRIGVGRSPRLIRELRRVTAEVWAVKTRKGKYWNTAYYLAPNRAVVQAEQNITNRDAAA